MMHPEALQWLNCIPTGTPNLPTNIVDFREFDSSIILNSRGGIPRPVGDFPESLSPAMLVGTVLVGRLGVDCELVVAGSRFLAPRRQQCHAVQTVRKQGAYSMVV